MFVTKITVQLKTKFGERVLLDCVKEDGGVKQIWLTPEKFLELFPEGLELKRKLTTESSEGLEFSYDDRQRVTGVVFK